MATTSYGSPYVQSSDLVSGWPATSLSVADRIDDVSFKGNGVNNQTATYTTVLTDAGKTIVMNVGSANDLTLQASGTAAYEIGTMIRIVNKGAGITTVKPAGGVTLNGGNITLAQYASTTVACIATDIWSPVSAPAANSAGLVLVNETTFSSAASVSINNCFSSTYANYRVVLTPTAGTVADTWIYGRLRAAGTDDSANNYQTDRVYQFGTTVAGDTNPAGDGTKWTFVNAASGYVNRAQMVGDIFSPALTVPTIFTGVSYFTNSTPNNQQNLLTGMKVTSTSYDGITLFTSSGTMTGTVRVYGYRNSL